MVIENVRVPAQDGQRDHVLKDMGDRGFTLVAITDDGWMAGQKLGIHQWSLYFTKVVKDA